MTVIPKLFSRTEMLEETSCIAVDSAVCRLSDAPLRSAFPDQRAVHRHDIALTAEVIIGYRSFQAQILTISTGGLMLRFAVAPPLRKGTQLLVCASGLAPISGSVCWFSEAECGIAFNVALAEDMLRNTGALFDPGKRARPGRARIRLAAIARARGVERKVVIENVSSGGAQISSGLSFPMAVGREMMLEVEGLPPIGGHVRWGTNGQTGLMFDRLLPIMTARGITDRCPTHPSWFAEVLTSHWLLTRSEQVPPAVNANQTSS